MFIDVKGWTSLAVFRFESQLMPLEIEFQTGQVSVCTCIILNLDKTKFGLTFMNILQKS